MLVLLAASSIRIGHMPILYMSRFLGFKCAPLKYEISKFRELKCYEDPSECV